MSRKTRTQHLQHTFMQMITKITDLSQSERKKVEELTYEIARDLERKMRISFSLTLLVGLMMGAMISFWIFSLFIQKL